MLLQSSTARCTCLGGRGLEGVLSTSCGLDLASLKWSAPCPMPNPRCAHSIVCLFGSPSAPSPSLASPPAPPAPPPLSHVAADDETATSCRDSLDLAGESTPSGDDMPTVAMIGGWDGGATVYGDVMVGQFFRGKWHWQLETQLEGDTMCPRFAAASCAIAAVDLPEEQRWKPDEEQDGAGAVGGENVTSSLRNEAASTAPPASTAMDESGAEKSGEFKGDIAGTPAAPVGLTFGVSEEMGSSRKVSSNGTKAPAVFLFSGVNFADDLGDLFRLELEEALEDIPLPTAQDDLFTGSSMNLSVGGTRMTLAKSPPKVAPKE